MKAIFFYSKNSEQCKKLLSRYSLDWNRFFSFVCVDSKDARAVLEGSTEIDVVPSVLIINPANRTRIVYKNEDLDNWLYQIIQEQEKEIPRDEAPPMSDEAS